MASVAVFGLGYVGCVSAACLARLGHRVTGVDRDEHKVQAVGQGRAPFYEPGLEELVAEGVSAGRLRATSSAAEGLAGAEVAFLCVGTPSARSGNLDLDQLRRVSEQIGAERGRSPLVVAVRSTVFPGTCEEVVAPAVGDAAVASNPEFLREGNAVGDFLNPSLVVVGSDDAAAREQVAALYAGLNAEPCRVSLRTAEMIKYACNAFHAVKVGFANEMGTLAGELGVSGAEVMATLCRDNKLNISPAYLQPGFAFGGSCLPKDLRALVYRAGRLDLRLPLLESVLSSNDAHLARSIQRVLDLDAERLAVYGLAFKENTDDLRESPVVTLLEQLIGKGRAVRVFDPHIRLESLHGANRSFLLRSIPHVERLLVGSLDELVEWGEYIVVAQKPTAAAAARIEASRRRVLSLVG
ncbi:MAG: nucleotide sugar dehydrogenase [Bryobacteraceae bacterium]